MIIHGFFAKHISVLFFLVFQGCLFPGTSFSATRKQNILRTLTLVDDQTDVILAQGIESAVPKEEEGLQPPEEDDLEVLYPTRHQYFQFGNEGTPVVKVRSTSFGCGKLGHQVWTTSLALSLLLCSQYNNSTGPNPTPNMEGINVLELGAGCGLPSVVSSQILKASTVIATDFWYHDDSNGEDDRPTDRLIPEIWHGINLQYNLDLEGNRPKNTLETVDDTSSESTAFSQRLDWHDKTTLKECMMVSDETTSSEQHRKIDLVMGSDLIYYDADIDPLWSTLMSLLLDYDVPQILVVSPLEQGTREALAPFLERARKESKEEDAVYSLQEQALVLYKSAEDLNQRQDGTRLVATTFIKKK